MNYKEKYQEALERAKEALLTSTSYGMSVIKEIFPELKENEDEKIRKAIIDFLELPHPQFVGKRDHEKWIAWLEKQGEPNPYSGVSFEYNGNIWGMCARDNGVDILLDKQLFKHLEKQGEQTTDPCTDCANDKGCVTCEHGELRETHTRTLNPDKVIEWLEEKQPSVSLVNKFKEDFNL